MRIVSYYLAAYVVLVLGALAALWYGGVLAQIAPIWILLALAIAAGFGIMLAMVTRQPNTPADL